MKKPLVFISSPYSQGSEAVNASFQMDIFYRLMNGGLVTPYPSLWTHFYHSFCPRPYEDWVELDNGILVRCDAVLALDAVRYVGKELYEQRESVGRDKEVKLAEENGIPVFDNIVDLEWWAKHEFSTINRPVGE